MTKAFCYAELQKQKVCLAKPADNQGVEANMHSHKQNTFFFFGLQTGECPIAINVHFCFCLAFWPGIF